MPSNPIQEATKLIKNYSVQGRYIILKTENGAVHHWLEPKHSIRVPESQITEQVKTLHRRKLVIISN